MVDKGKRPMDPFKDPSNKKIKYSIPATDRLNLQPPPGFQHPNRPTLDKGKRPIDPSLDPSNRPKNTFIPLQDRLNLQPPRGFQRPDRPNLQNRKRPLDHSLDPLNKKKRVFVPPPDRLTLHQPHSFQVQPSPSPIKDIRLTNRIIAQRARREREKLNKQNGHQAMAHRLSGFVVYVHPPIPGTPPQTVRLPPQHSPITPHTTSTKRLNSTESLRTSLSALNPIRLFTLPEECTHVDSAPVSNRNESFASTSSYQNASLILSTSSFTDAIPHLPSMGFESISADQNSRPQSFQHTAQPFSERADTMSEDDDEEALDYNGDVHTTLNPNRPVEQGRHYLGKMDVQCPFCKALHWMDERLSKSSLSRPLFGRCCLQGKIKRPPLQPLPPALKALYDGNDRKSKSFRRYMRQYNQAFAFTSLGVQEHLFAGRGPRPFTIHGELRHRTGALIPDAGYQATYSQLYIYDPSAALAVRQLRNPKLNTDVLKIIQATMLQYNRFSDTYRHTYDVLRSASSEHGEDFNVPAYLHYTASRDSRRYNLPTADEVAVILPGDGSERASMRDIVIYLKGGQEFMQISECHPAYLPLHYVLLFPHGELGWTPELRRWDSSTATTTNDRLTQMNFYSYLLFARTTEYSAILRGRKLFEEFGVDGWASTEQNKMRYYRQQQDKLRAELYQGITDVSADAVDPNQIGRRVVLPSSCIGSPRHMFEIFQDSMAITRYNHHPDIFLTMTANPQWTEILEALFTNQTAYDRPEVVACAFELKRRALMEVIKKRGVLGMAVAHVYTIEFQKRGLPHMHALIYLRHSDKIRVPAQVDRIVSAEFPDPDTEPELFRTVLRCMVHGPCGLNNPNSPCMVNRQCKYHYPRAFTDCTTMDTNGYALYRRRDNGKSYFVREHSVDNRNVVPYNPYLSKMFDCHINVEVCAGLTCVKYIHKYIFKGNDRTTIVLNELDEIKQYLDGDILGHLKLL